MTREDRPDGDPVAHPHDRVVREVLADGSYIAGESRSILPPELVMELSARAGLEGLTAAPTSFIDEALGQRSCDLLYTGLIDGQTVYYLLLEHQSSSDWWMALRVLEYAVGIWRRHRKEHPRERSLPLVIPMVIHHGLQPWTAPLDLGELFGLDERLRGALGGLLPRFGYVLDDLAGVDEAQLQARPLPTGAALLLWLLKVVAGNADVPADLAGWTGHLRALSHDPARERELATLLAYIRNAGDTSEERLHAFVRTLGPEMERAYMTTTEQIQARCHAEGREEGIAEGIATTLLRLIEKKFGPVDAATRERVRSASEAELDAWTDQVLTAATLREMLG